MDMAKPKIRFKGYQDDWEQRKLGEILISLQNNTLSRADLSNETGVAKNVHYGDVLIKFGEILDVSKEQLQMILDESVLTKYKSSFLQNGDVIVADTAEDSTVGKCSEIAGLNDEVVLSGLHTIPYRPVKKFATGYLGYYLNSNMYHNQLIPLMQGIKVTSISKSAMQDTNIVYPKLIEEQTMIGSYFKSLDHLITLHQRKCDEAKKLKKFMLQKMFPQNGSLVPEIRFDGFTDDWEQRKLGDFGKATGGTSIESEFSEDGIYKVISIGSYSENSVYNDQGIRAIKSDKTSNRILNRNDLTMILNDKTTSGNIIGRVLLIEESGIYVYNQRTERIEINLDEYDPVFLYEMLNAPNIREKIIKQAQGNTQIYVNWTAISLLEYMIPSKEEQVKIGEYLHSISNLITLHQQKCDDLINLKKYMLQNMFV